MKILIVNYECPPLGGGGGVACFQLAQELAKKHDVDYLTTGFKSLPKFEIVSNVRIFRVPVLNRTELSTATYWSMLSFAPSGFIKGISLCKNSRYDCIHAFFVVPSGLCGWGLSRFFGVPLVLSALGGDVYDPSKRFSPHKSIILKKIISFLFNHADKNTVESRNLKKIILKNYPIHKQIEVIPLGLTRPDFVKKTRSELTLPDDIIILISVGRLVPRKGYAFALEALANISSPGCHYLVIGDGPEEQSLKNIARQLHVEDMVTFLGFLPDELKFQYLSASDIYVLPSVHEGFGICLLEAMHCGLPIVSTDEGGQTDILIDGRNALLVPPGDSIALSEKIRQLLNDDLLRMNISGNNRTDIGNYYIDEIVKEYENIYIELKNSGK